MKEVKNNITNNTFSTVDSKTLLLIRHAKSDWNDPTLSDFDRPLNLRGKRNAPVMANRLYNKQIKIDAFVSSPAKRARRTATIFAKKYNVKKGDVILVDKLYAAESDIFYKVIANMDDAFTSIAIFAHNPGLTDFANHLTDVRIDNIPTCSVFALKVATKHWNDFVDAKKEFWFFDQPKEISE